MMKVRSLWAGITILVALATRAPAVVIQVPVTAAYLKENPDEITVKVEKRDDGLLHYTITRHLKEERYLVAHFTVRSDSKVIAESHCPAYVRQPSATYFLVVSPEKLGDTHFEISENPFVRSHDQDVAIPGGYIFTFNLKDFAPTDGPKPPGPN
ncbi:MAG TPA: hypothetical protein VGZ22_04715 [Isosphaeraceae bacterium]|jgi:hypothetical protein|nr:hypothetical protein [Isosphaeraceae bacterium]